jgi:hypothetical protein
MDQEEEYQEVVQVMLLWMRVDETRAAVCTRLAGDSS